jgi:hypothetical protein
MDSEQMKCKTGHPEVPLTYWYIRMGTALFNQENKLTSDGWLNRLPRIVALHFVLRVADSIIIYWSCPKLRSKCGA